MTVQEESWLRHLGGVQVGSRVRYTAAQPDPKRQNEQGTVKAVFAPHYVVVHWDSFQDGETNDCGSSICELVDDTNEQHRALRENLDETKKIIFDAIRKVAPKSGEAIITVIEDLLNRERALTESKTVVRLAREYDSFLLTGRPRQ